MLTKGHFKFWVSNWGTSSEHLFFIDAAKMANHTVPAAGTSITGPRFCIVVVSY